MARRKSAETPNRFARILATLFTSLIAPTIVGLVTTAIREKAVAKSPVVAVEGRKVDTAPVVSPAVTLLPPAPVPYRPVVIRTPLVCRPAAPTTSVTERRSIHSPGPG
jgi:hypothetical protein